ncbi:M6 family metalloprotease domain-containing protein [Pyxidicoccus fallax]|uniref:M6 family metalloprotease domain-containing protein n=1 Tax=Pyxidicoccus fallax TaxID=394095 RepID=A0A848LU86_9BACT|nr:immune inhibitor A domain-containing protein [Pyxidicoccus fallax]NMO21162.1 M6 family metalloprotease domain-containing protein [Pyxidicoccus fallax]NPC82188.1 M6 family metalloprotease domain-containing protein [Pyxidicoccus fallax]
MKFRTQWLKWGLLALTVSPGAWAKRPVLDEDGSVGVGHARQRMSDDLSHPLGERQRMLRAQALKDKMEGRTRGRVHRTAGGRYVELELERTDRIFVILAEFGDQVHPEYGNPDVNPGGDIPGPLHNQILPPDRATNNFTIWQQDYNREHYERLYFGTGPGVDSVATYYQTQSSGRYTVDGVVHEWVRVPYNSARYGHNLCGSRICTRTGMWPMVTDAVNAWTQAQLDAGKTPEQIKAYLDTFDVWDRYDYDHDGNFDEPDGYIDHFQIVHAGEGEETDGGAQGQNAIWSHRSFAFSSGGGHGGNGPAYNPNGGTRFGPVDKWVGDYTVQPENGGLGVFAHEYGHDLGLPDHYDTYSGYGNDSAFWTLMGHGSYLGDGTVDVGSRPGDLWAWDKLQLGWLNYDEAKAGERSTHKLGPAEMNTKHAQALLVTLPPQVVDHVTTPPFAGQFAWYSGQGNNVDSSMTRTVRLPRASSVQLTLRTWFDIEQDWDYAYVSVSTDGQRFENLPSSITTQTDPNNQNFGNGITGVSGGWIPVTFDLTPWAGKTVHLRLRYWTDGAEVRPGFQVDALSITANGRTVFSDGAEATPNGWTLDGFQQHDGLHIHFDHYYLAEYRQYRSYDEGLETGPYHFPYGDMGLTYYVEHYPYEPGLLITYWNTLFTNNQVSLHPGQGRILPVDAHAAPQLDGTGWYWDTFVQVRDAPFGLKPTQALSLKTLGGPRIDLPSLPAETVFDDTKPYWSEDTFWMGVKVPNTGTIIEVINEKGDGRSMRVKVRPAR